MNVLILILILVGGGLASGSYPFLGAILLVIGGGLAVKDLLKSKQ